jgi:hypothetical protein
MIIRYGSNYDLSGLEERREMLERLPELIERTRNAAIDPEKRIERIVVPIEGSLTGTISKPVYVSY